MADQFITGTAKLIGDPILRARRTVLFEGLGVRHSGVYEITQARHEMSANSPYYTKLKVRRVIEPLVVAERRAPAKRKSTGKAFCKRSPLHLLVCEERFRLDFQQHNFGTKHVDRFLIEHREITVGSGRSPKYLQLMDQFNKLSKRRQLAELYSTKDLGAF